MDKTQWEVFDDLVRAAKEIVWMKMPGESSYLFMSSAAETIYGRSNAEFNADPGLWLSVVHPDDQEIVVSKDDQLFEQGFADLEYRIVRPDGGIRWLKDLSYQVSNEQGQVLYLGGIALDITKQKLDELAQRDRTRELTGERDAAERRYRNVFDGAGDPMYIISPDGFITALNPAWSRVTGYARDDLLGQPFAPLVEPEYLPVTMDAFDRALQGEAVTFEARYLAASGEYRSVEHTLAPQWNHRGEVVEVIGVARDLTERRQAEQERLELERQVQQAQKMESLGILAGGIAHDFNNLLMGVLGNAELLLVDLPAASPHTDLVQAIKTASERLSDLARQMLIYAGRGHDILEPVDIPAVIADVVTLLQTSSKKVELHTDFPADLPPVHGNVSKVRQVLLNLVMNAIEAVGDKGGVVTLAASVVAVDDATRSEPWLGTQPTDGDSVRVEVSDDGCDVDAETQARMFEPFFTTKGAGRGLGLASVLGIIRAHKGAIRFEAKRGHGGKAIALWPRYESQNDTASVPSERSAAPTMSNVVLVVDDEPTVRSITKQFLERDGHTVFTANDGRQALLLLDEKAADIDLVLLDMQMPKMDGMEVLEQIHDKWPALRVVLSSGYPLNDPTGRQDAGASAFLQKPYSRAELLGVVDRLLAHRAR